ncbi:MAG: hypothetical protein QM483_09995 [Desulfuromusa sp.]
MSEIAPTFTRVQFLGAVISGLLVDTMSHQQSFPLPAKFAAVPVTAGVYFTAVLNDETVLNFSYLHLYQMASGQATVEARVLGNHLGRHWVDTAVGQVLKIFSEARDISGKVLSSDLVSEAIVQHLQNDVSKLKLYAIGSPDQRPPRTLPISTILFRQIRSSGRRSIRFPLVWGLQAGDTITHPDITDFQIESFSMTVQPKYKVIDATESL